MTRSLLKDFSTKGIPKELLSDLNGLLAANSPSLLPLLDDIQKQVNLSLPIVKCPSEWAQFLSALASPSPVCGLVHPSDQLFGILRRIHNVTRDVSSMSILQKEVPVLFDLLGCVSQIPQSLSQVIEKLIEKSLAPFGQDMQNADTEVSVYASKSENVLCELSYFPCLPKVRARGLYGIDAHNRRAMRCTKQHSGHPTLLPGIFTIYCPHGELTYVKQGH